MGAFWSGGLKSDTTLIKFKGRKKSKLTDLSSRNNFIKTQETQMDYECSSIEPIFQRQF